MTAMNVTMLPADAYGCGYYRMRMPGHYAEANVTWREGFPIAPDGTVRLEPGTDLVVFQRPMDVRIPLLIHRLQKQGVAVVVEIDDDMTRLDPQHIAWRDVHPAHSPNANWRHLKNACLVADLVTCSTPALAETFAKHDRYAVLPNYVEGALLDVQAEQSGFGWAGYVPTHPNDLRVVGTAVSDLVAEGYDFKVIGPALGVQGALHLSAEPMATGWLDLQDYYRAVAGLAAGIVPLADSAFNRAKSWLKGLEYAALGVPFVATPTPEYCELQNHGCGLLTEKPKHWRGHLRRLLTDEDGRRELADHARAGVRANLTIEGNAWRWDEAWHQALKNRLAAGKTPVAA